MFYAFLIAFQEENNPPGLLVEISKMEAIFQQKRHKCWTIFGKNEKQLILRVLVDLIFLGHCHSNRTGKRKISLSEFLECCFCFDKEINKIGGREQTFGDESRQNLNFS